MHIFSFLLKPSIFLPAISITDDLVSLIFAPLLKDRYISRFTVSPQGGVLSIPEVGLSLVVPEGALPPGGPGGGKGEVDIILGVSYNPADTPTIGATHTIPCPTVLCATRPARLHFRRPVALVFAHSGGGPVLAKTRTTPRILHSLTDVGHVTRWEAFSSIDDYDNDEDGDQGTEADEEFGCVNGEHCILFLNQLRLFSLVTDHGSGGGMRTATKYVRVVVFVSYSPGRDSVALNVYTTDSLPSERQVSRFYSPYIVYIFLVARFLIYVLYIVSLSNTCTHNHRFIRI